MIKGTAKTPLEDIKRRALDHYEEASNAIHHHNSFIPQAIRAYQEPEDKEVEGSWSGDFFENTIIFLVAYVFSLFLLIPVFKLISPQEQQWTYAALFSTASIVATFKFLLAKIIQKLNHK